MESLEKEKKKLLNPMKTRSDFLPVMNWKKRNRTGC